MSCAELVTGDTVLKAFTHLWKAKQESDILSATIKVSREYVL